jgi:HAD superfamily hydrolase (TIGR01662 family)
MRRSPVAGDDPGVTAAQDEAPAAHVRYTIVIPTIGRQSLFVLLQSLVEQNWTRTGYPKVIVVDDRPMTGDYRPQDLQWAHSPWPITSLRTGGRGPAAARNAGWRTARTPWVVFLDDDVLVSPDWSDCLHRDLLAATPTTGGVQARVRVPAPEDRRPTDWERNTAGLAAAKWITADMAYRRAALAQVAGFDERFPRAYREDADLAVRVRRAGWTLMRGQRVTVHPVRQADDWVSLRTQAGNADDALLRALYGRRWRAITEAGPGRTGRHLATVAVAAAAPLAILFGRRRLAGALTGLWGVLTAQFFVHRVAAGPAPGTAEFTAELRRMAVTSPLIPFAALRARCRGILRHGLRTTAWPPQIRAVLFDRDGTLVHDEPYNADPDMVRPVAQARRVLDDVRSAGIRIAVISNQSGIGRGLLTSDQLRLVNERIAELLGPIDLWEVCPHTPLDRCWCRKPEALLVWRAAAALGVQPAECAVIGDIGADMGAATAGGAVGVLVPTSVTRMEEIDSAELVARTLREAVELVLSRDGRSLSSMAPIADAMVAPATPATGRSA